MYKRLYTRMKEKKIQARFYFAKVDYIHIFRAFMERNNYNPEISTE